MSATQDGSVPAFPNDYMGDPAYDGLTARAYAAIRLRVPASGEAWLDAMIRQSVRDEDARAALTGFVANDKLIQTSILMAKEDRSTPEAVIGQRCGKIATALAAARSVPATAPEQGEAAKTPEPERDAKAEALAQELRDAARVLDMAAKYASQDVAAVYGGSAHAARAALAAWEAGK